VTALPISLYEKAHPNGTLGIRQKAVDFAMDTGIRINSITGYYVCYGLHHEDRNPVE
jgi:L-ribulose-5-phosphate 3-epimerase UlaE